MARAAARRSYARDARGRFASGGGAAKNGSSKAAGQRAAPVKKQAARKTSSQTQAAKPKKPARKKPSIENRIRQAWIRNNNRERTNDNRNWGGGAINESTSVEKSMARIKNQRNRQNQQSQALTNLIAKLKPSGQAKANKLRRHYGI